MDLITMLDAVIFVALAVHLLLRSRSTGQPALRRLAWFLLAFALAAGSIPTLSEENALAIVTLLGGLTAYPVLLLHFGASLTTRPRPLERFALGVLVAEALVMGVMPVVLSHLDALLVDLYVAAGFALVAHVVVHVVVRRQARLLPSSFVRRRALALSGGLMVLALSLGAGVVGSTLTDLSLVIALVGAGIGGVLLTAATRPPRWLQAAFAQSDYDVLVAAEEKVLTSEDPRAAVRELLEGLVRLLGGQAAWLVHDGETVAEVGTVPDLPDDQTSGAEDGGNGASVRPVTDSRGEVLWMFTAAELSCRLGVVAGRDPVMYGLDLTDLLPRTTRRIAIALEGRQLEQRRRAHARAEQEAEHYRRVAELKDDLLSTINHELRTPLGIVTGALELATSRWADVGEDQRRTLVERADANARMLSEVILEVLSLIELRSGTTVPTPAAVTLDDLLERALIGLDADGRVDRLVDGGVQVVIDTGLGARVLRQLADNALQHTDGPVEIEAIVTDEHLELVVRDRGPGLGADLLGPFERGGHYLRRTTHGLGLGLSLVTETAEVLGGDVRFDHDGGGTTVTCRLPHQGTVAEVGAPDVIRAGAREV